MRKTWYVWYKYSGVNCWQLLTDVVEVSAEAALSRCHMALVRASNDSGQYRAFSRPTLPWGINR